MDEPEHGSYSAGFLAQTIDNKMAQLRGTTNSFFLGISSQNYKFAGDICLLVVAVALVVERVVVVVVEVGKGSPRRSKATLVDCCCYCWLCAWPG